jgi:Fungal specific transcription factor domain
MQNGPFTQMDHCRSILMPEFLDENIQDLDLFSFDMTPLHDDGEASFVDLDYFGLGGSHSKNASTDSTGSCFHSKSPTWISASLTSTRESSQAGSERTQLLSLSADSSSGSELQVPVEPSASEHDNHWHDAFAQCKRLRFLLRGIAGRPYDDGVPSQPEHETVRPLMETFARLDRVAQYERESRALTLSRPMTAPLTARAARDLLPPRQTCDVLLDAYIKTFESVLRIVHVISFLRDYERFWGSSTSRSMDAEEPFACKLLVAIALGSFMCQSPHVPANSERALGSSLQEQASGWIAHAKQWLAHKMVAGSRADLDMAQIVCLLALARHTQYHHAASIGAAWLPGDHDLTRIGIQMGLHREPRIRSPAMSAKEAEIRRRLWATMLELSLQMCFDEGLPAPLAPESYDCEAPSSIADEDIELGLGSPGLTPTTVLVLLARTQRLRLRILHLVNAPGASKAYDESHRLAAELNAACCADLDVLRSMKPQPTDFQIKLLDIFTRPFVLALHGPFADQASTEPGHYYSRRMRMEVSALLLEHPLLPVLTPTEGPVSGLELAKATNQTNTTTTAAPSTSESIGGTTTGRDAYAALRIHGHGHFALVQRQATAALCLDLISELEENAFPTLDDASRRQLRDVLRSAVGVFVRRVRAAGGAHSAREFLLFACADAYIEAMQRGCRSRDADEAIAEAARAALAVCCEVMERQRRVEQPGAARLGEGQGEEDIQMWLHSDEHGGDGAASAGDGGLDFQSLAFAQAFHDPGCN